MVFLEARHWAFRLRHGWLILSAIQAYAFVVLLPQFFKNNWEFIRSLYGSEFMFGALSPWIMHLIQLLANNAIFGFLYMSNIPFFEQYKISNKPWPWKSEDEATRERFWTTLRNGIMRVSINNFVIGLPLTFFSYWSNKDSGAFSTSLVDWPDTWTIIWQIGVCLLIEDAMFYHTHRFLHWKVIYPYIHKRHHEFYHSIVIASENAHPIEYLLGNLIPVLAGPLLVKAHIVVYWMFIWTRIMESTDAHSGYDFPWTISRLLPFGSSIAAHDYHHSHNIGCYGSQFMFWDRVYGTDHEFIAHEEKRLVRVGIFSKPADGAPGGENHAGDQQGSARNGVTEADALHKRST